MIYKKNNSVSNSTLPEIAKQSTNKLSLKNSTKSLFANKHNTKKIHLNLPKFTRSYKVAYNSEQDDNKIILTNNNNYLNNNNDNDIDTNKFNEYVQNLIKLKTNNSLEQNPLIEKIVFTEEKNNNNENYDIFFEEKQSKEGTMQTIKENSITGNDNENSEHSTVNINNVNNINNMNNVIKPINNNNETNINNMTTKINARTYINSLTTIGNEKDNNNYLDSNNFNYNFKNNRLNQKLSLEHVDNYSIGGRNRLSKLKQKVIKASEDKINNNMNISENFDTYPNIKDNFYQYTNSLQIKNNKNIKINSINYNINNNYNLNNIINNSIKENDTTFHKTTNNFSVKNLRSLALLNSNYLSNKNYLDTFGNFNLKFKKEKSIYDVKNQNKLIHQYQAFSESKESKSLHSLINRPRRPLLETYDMRNRHLKFKDVYLDDNFIKFVREQKRKVKSKVNGNQDINTVEISLEKDPLYIKAIKALKNMNKEIITLSKKIRKNLLLSKINLPTFINLKGDKYYQYSINYNQKKKCLYEGNKVQLNYNNSHKLINSNSNKNLINNKDKYKLGRNHSSKNNIHIKNNNNINNNIESYTLYNTMNKLNNLRSNLNNKNLNCKILKRNSSNTYKNKELV